MKLIIQTDLNLASDHRDRGVASWIHILGHCFLSGHAVEGRGCVVDPLDAGVAAVEQDKGLVRIRFLGHRPYPFAHRTPVLYSRNQSRTNIAL